MRTLVLRALGLGDLLTIVPALRALRAYSPAARLLLAGPASLAELARLAGVDEVVDTAPLARLDPSTHGCALAVNLHGRGPQSTDLLTTTDPERLVAFGRTAVWRAEEHEVTRWCRLLAEAGIPADPTLLELDPPGLASAAPGAVLVHAGAAQPSRLWPVERWAAVARELTARGGDVLLTGSPAERSRALAVAVGAGLPESAVVAGQTSPLQLAALVREAALLVSVDTGVAHLATAYGTPSVVLFGPTSPALWGPPLDRPQHRVLWAGTEGDNFDADAHPGLLRLSADAVMREAQSMV